jgi:hypothetical protein
MSFNSHFQADLGPQYASLLSAPIVSPGRQSTSPHRVHHGQQVQGVSPHRYSQSPTFHDGPAVLSPASPPQPTTAYDPLAMQQPQFVGYTQPLYEEGHSDKRRLARKLKGKLNDMVHGEVPGFRTAQNITSPTIEVGMSPAYPLSSTDYDDALAGYSNSYAHPYTPGGGNARRAYRGTTGSGDVYASDPVVDPYELVDGWRLTA